MGRKRIKPDYDPMKIQEEMITLCKSLYIVSEEALDEAKNNKKNKVSLRTLANELGISVSKVVKLLITGGCYTSDICRKINDMYAEGKTVPKIQESLNVSRATVQSYLPYNKGVYKTRDISVNAERIRIYRERCSCIEALREGLSEDDLWDAVVAFQDYSFHTVTGLKYTYSLKTGRDGHYNRELLVSRRAESKSLAWSSVMLAFDKAFQMCGQVVERPKALGDIRGVSYIYPMFYRFGLISAPEKLAEKMQLRGGAFSRV